MEVDDANGILNWKWRERSDVSIQNIGVCVIKVAPFSGNFGA